MMTVLGIDADFHRVAFAVLNGTGVKATGTIERANRAGRIDGRYDSRLTAMCRRASEVGAVIYLEGIFLSEPKGGAGNHLPNRRNVLGFARLAEVQGEIKRSARLSAVPVEVVSPSAWHRAVLGFTKPREKLKAAALNEAGELTGRVDLSEHEADAVCLGLYGIQNERAPSVLVTVRT